MPRMPLRILVLCLALGSPLLMEMTPALAGGGPEPARAVDLSRLAGRWYLVARLPGIAGQQGLGAQVEYRLDGGKLEESYVAHRGSLDGPLEKEHLQLTPDDEQPARWVKRSWLSSQERLLLYVSPAYRRAIVGDPGRDWAWVLARAPEIPERGPQKAEQTGKAGFE